MISHFKFIWHHLVVSSISILTGILLIVFVPIDFPVIHFLIMVGVITLITIVTYLIMARGVALSDKEGVFYLIGGIGLKFILYLFFILIYWIITKNLSKPFIIAFFLLYLVFTFLMARALLKLLKIK